MTLNRTTAQDSNLAAIDARSYLADDRNQPPVDVDWLRQENKDDRHAALANQQNNR